MTLTYQTDSFSLDAERIVDETHPVFGDMTVFKGVVIASEIVQEYNDGLALKSRDELEAYVWTVNDRWIIAGAHPTDGIISERDQVAGRTTNAKFVKDLKDPKTNRKTRAGVRADIQVFNDKIQPALLKDMKNGLKADVSIGFFFSKDDTSGVVTDGILKGEEFDYKQTNMFHDHLAVGIDNGRCPSPLCGLGADEIKQRIAGDPFAGFKDFEDCVSKIMAKNSKLSKKSAEKICGSLKAKSEDNKLEDNSLRKSLKALAQAIMDEMQEIQAMKDAVQNKEPDWYLTIPWKEEPYQTTFDNLNEETRQLIIDAGLCPTCGPKVLGMDLSLEQINAKLDDLKGDRDKVREEMRVLEDELFSKTPEEKKRDDELRNQINQLWDEISDINDEIFAFGQAKTIKITEGALNDAGECPDGQEWSEEHDKCVPIKDGDVKESNPGFKLAETVAEQECPEGMEWNAKKGQCVEIANFSDRPENKLVPDEVLKRYETLSASG